MIKHDFNQLLRAKAIPFLGNDVDTDRIVPARFLKEITFDKMGDFMFYDLRHLPSGEINDNCVFNDARFKQASILIVEENFGCGSSREHAPQAIQRYGFQCLIGISFAEIFAGNCRSLGIPTLSLSVQDIKRLMHCVNADPSLVVSVSLEAQKVFVEGQDPFELTNSPETLAPFLSGAWDALGILKKNMDLIQKKAADIPYFDNFKTYNIKS